MHYLRLFFLLCAIPLASCSKYQAASGEEPDKPSSETETTYTLFLQIDSRDHAQINYPLSVFIFDSANNCTAQETIPNKEADYSARLPAGRYRVVVFSGLENCGYTYPLQIIPGSFIRQNESLYTSVPLQTGKINLSLTQSTAALVTLSYIVAAVRVTVYGVPSHTQGVDMQLSPVSSALSFDGNYRNDTETVTMLCRQEGSTWVSDEVYVFPCESSQTNLSIHIRKDGEDEVYGYTYLSPLKAGFPYHFAGYYAGDITLNGTFQNKGWQQTEEVTFGLEEPQQPDPTDPEEPGAGSDLPEVRVGELPAEGDVWQECLVCQTEPGTSARRKALVIANDNLYIKADDTALYLADYHFNDLDNWRTFTTEEATAFRNAHYGVHTVSELNDFLLDNMIEPFKYDTGDRYLCNDGKSSFCLTTKTISAAGKTKNYYLRPVKAVCFVTR